MHNWREREFQPMPESLLGADSRESLRARVTRFAAYSEAMKTQNQLNVNIIRVI
jgi:hypothetical protein